jgi:hypothetical protein
MKPEPRPPVYTGFRTPPSDAIIGLQMSSDGLTALCINAHTVLLTWPDGCAAVPRMFREPRLRAAYGGIWLHTRDRTAFGVGPGQLAEWPGSDGRP